MAGSDTSQSRHASQEKVRVFEIAEQQKIRKHAGREPAPASARISAFLNANAAEVINDDRCGQYKKINMLPGEVEICAGH